MCPDEKTVLKRIAEGDEAAFRVLFGYYYPKVKCFLAELIANEDDVKDLAQNIFIKIWLLRASLEEVRSFGAYLYRMTRNAAIDYCRKHKVKIPLTDQYNEEESYPLDESYFARERQLQYEASIHNQPDKRRQVFLLSRVDGLSNTEIAQRLGISKKTVENHINAVLRELRKISSCIAIFC